MNLNKHYRIKPRGKKQKRILPDEREITGSVQTHEYYEEAAPIDQKLWDHFMNKEPVAIPNPHDTRGIIEWVRKYSLNLALLFIVLFLAAMLAAVSYLHMQEPHTIQEVTHAK